MELSQRAARAVVLAALAVAYVVAGPAPPLTRALERTYLVAVIDQRRPATPRTRPLPVRVGYGPHPVRPRGARP